MLFNNAEHAESFLVNLADSLRDCVGDEARKMTELLRVHTRDTKLDLHIADLPYATALGRHKMCVWMKLTLVHVMSSCPNRHTSLRSTSPVDAFNQYISKVYNVRLVLDAYTPASELWHASVKKYAVIENGWARALIG